MGKTILFVSHDLSSISKYCDRVILLNQGEKLGEGSPKEMIDAYKQVLVGQYSKDANDDATKSEVEAVINKGLNPETLEYGSKKAKITSCRITDEQGRETTAIIKGNDFTIHMEAEAIEDLQAPIFAFSIKNIKGTEITGTNTMFEKAFLDKMQAGEKKEITFKQHMNLQGGEYLLSLGLTGYEGSDFTVYHRLYDVINITVISDKDTVGFYDMESEVEVKSLWTPAIVGGNNGEDKDNRQNHIG
jgi:teichoic acid transport system ATP-binding protein